jgi:hypothetical protein
MVQDTAQITDCSRCRVKVRPSPPLQRCLIRPSSQPQQGDARHMAAGFQGDQHGDRSGWLTSWRLVVAVSPLK